LAFSSSNELKSEEIGYVDIFDFFSSSLF